MRLRTYKVIDTYDARHPFGLVDAHDEVIRVDAKPEWLADYAFEELFADQVLDVEGEVMRESDRARKTRERRTEE